MAVKSREELLASINALIGDNTSDEAIALVEDFADTYSDMEQKANPGGVDWKSKYEQNDAEWRKKYTDRFFKSPADSDDNNNNDNDEPERKPLTFENLFKEGK